MLRQSLAAASCDQHEDFYSILTLSLSKGEERSASADEMVPWTISSDERRELERAAGEG